MIFDYPYNMNASAPKGALYGYCKDERLDYWYTVAHIKKKRRTAYKTLVLLKGLFRKRQRRTEFCEQNCQCHLIKTEGLEL